MQLPEFFRKVTTKTEMNNNASGRAIRKSMNLVVAGKRLPEWHPVLF